MAVAEKLLLLKPAHTSNSATTMIVKILITQGLHSNSFLGLPYRFLNMNPKKELRWSLRVKMKYLRGSSQVVLFVRLCIAKHVALKTGRSVGAVALGFPLKGSIRVPFKGVYKDYYKGSIRVL